MRGFRRIVAGMLVFMMVAGMLPWGPGLFINQAKAAGTLVVNISEDSTGKLLSEDSVTLEWKDIGADSYTLSFYDPQKVFHTMTLTAAGESVIKQKIGDPNMGFTLQKDFIYRFTVTANFNGSPAQTYTKTVITGITFEVPKEISEGRLPDSPVSLSGGGKEIGAKPGLRFKWKIPTMYDPGSSSIVPYTSMTGIFPVPIDYNISIGTDSSGTNKTQLKVRYSNLIKQYIATMFTGSQIRTIAEKVEVNPADEPGYIRFDCYGPDANNLADLIREDAAPNNYPAGNIDPQFNVNNMWDFPKDAGGNFDFSSVDLKTIYYDPDIKPGTVYRMKIEPVFNDASSSNFVEFLPTSVKDGYTYTPVRFQLFKDSSNNLLMTIFKINQQDALAGQTVNFTYQAYYSTNPQFAGASLSAQQSDEFAMGDVVVIFIENKNYNTPFYYKVKASSPTSGQVLSSNVIDYTVSLDKSQPPLPEDVEVVDVTLDKGTVTNTFYPNRQAADNQSYDVNTSDVKIRWKKPYNYTELMESDDPLYYHILLSTVQNPVTGGEERVDRIFENDANSKTYHHPDTESESKGYREVFRVNLKACTLSADGNYLEFTLKGAMLFSDVELVDGQPEYTQKLDKNSDDYPTYLLPNKVYYIKMYSKRDTMTSTPVSDTSIPVSFTTAAELQTSPPSPMNFTVLKNGVTDASGQVNHEPVVLEWQKVTYSPAQSIHYELFMSKGTYVEGHENDADNYYYTGIDSKDSQSTFVKIGTTAEASDVAFSGFSSSASPIVDASVSNFTSSAATGIFGEGLRPNTTYYFVVRTVAEVDGKIKRSNFSKIIAVTTLKGKIQEPGEDSLKPLTPENFGIAVDDKGNKMVDGTSVTLKWTEAESSVKYTLIRTSLKIDNNADIDTIAQNQQNKYVEYLRSKDATGDSPDFTYDSQTKEFRFKVSGLYPNTVYYFSLRAEKKTSDGTELDSLWVTIPVTTLLIESPQLLDVVAGNEVGVSFEDSSIYTSDDIKVYVDGDRVPAGQVFISEEPVDGGNSVYYVRIVSLKPDTAYSLNVQGSTVDGSGVTHSFSYDFPANQVDPVLNTQRTTTRDPMHQIDVKWKGKDGGRFELAIKGEKDSDYTVLQEGIGFVYMSKEKPANMVATDYSMYYARILSLESNTKYSIKVRSVESNLITGEDDYSVYVGPVTTRTEFSQQDYDDEEKRDNENTNYWDQVNKLKDSFYWVLQDTGGSYEMKVRGDKAAIWINNDVGSTFTISLSPSGNAAFSRGSAYIPLSVMELLLSKNESMVVKTPGAEYVIRPDSINLQDSEEIKKIRSDAAIKEIYLYIQVEKLNSANYSFPSSTRPASDLFNLSVQVTGMKNNTDAFTEEKIVETLDAYINAGLKKLQNTPAEDKDTSSKLGDVIDNIVDDMLADFQNDIRNMIENSSYGIRKTSKDISAFSTPVSVTMPVSSSGKELRSGYVYRSSGWSPVPTSQYGDSISFGITQPGKLIALSVSAADLFSIPAGHWAEKDINLFNSKFNIRDILDTGTGISVDDSISVEKAVALIAKVLSKDGKYAGSGTVGEKAGNMGLDGTINFSSPQRNLTRQEAASLIMKIYQLKTGADMSSLKPGKTLMIKDAGDIGAKYYKAVEMCVDMGLLTLNARNNFEPGQGCSWAQMISGLLRLLKKLGEISS
ncbi:MAG: fibronectin type III domain-containing protein [Clostridiales bacterium]|jgi:hypothetical protein|nr:fibronectin type III domain-containing protein [Eubacteriales bacterium]MDH7567013.1 fibronectin type III domain-containing protein [Clostridiales bacterium]